MALDPSKFTRKTQEAIGAAQAAGRDAGNTEIAPEQPRLYARDEHPDRLALLAEQAAADAIADDGAP